MINNIGDLVLNIVITLVNIILLPINLLIRQYLPTIDNALQYLNDFIDELTRYLSWGVDSLCLPQPVIIIITDYLIFKLTFPYLVWFIKLALKWYNNLKV